MKYPLPRDPININTTKLMRKELMMRKELVEFLSGLRTKYILITRIRADVNRDMVNI